MDKFKPIPQNSMPFPTTLPSSKPSSNSDIAYLIDSVDPTIQPFVQDEVVPEFVNLTPLPTLEEMVLAEAEELAEILELLENIEQAKEVILQKKQDLSTFLNSSYFSLPIPDNLREAYGVRQKIEKYTEVKEQKSTRGRPKKNKPSESLESSTSNVCVGVVVPSLSFSGSEIEGINTINDHENRKFTTDDLGVSL